ncbi:MAG TPA: hypothetical protein VI146_03370 [Nitrososphaeraceae archaeon]
MLADELNSLELPQALIDLLVENSFDKERISRMNIDDLAVILSIDIETAKIIVNSVSNYSNLMFHNMRELR